ncbi:MAG: response regulator [Synechococcales cyanobacterium RU_4_20]|nr:response regulator [Synechococcales cyanobacterium RU_4_20]NJR68496.1 response regulator [Synechococcales cyanobacterium CRU_2_2]
MNTALLVEDSITEVEVITRYLTQIGLNVVRAGSCEEAKERLIQGTPDLIILDVILPGQSGFELCRELKSDPATGKIPVVICSTKNTEADKLWGNLLGADAYCPKPVDQQEFEQIVRQLVKV